MFSLLLFLSFFFFFFFSLSLLFFFEQFFLCSNSNTSRISHEDCDCITENETERKLWKLWNYEQPEKKEERENEIGTETKYRYSYSYKYIPSKNVLIQFPIWQRAPKLNIIYFLLSFTLLYTKYMFRVRYFPQFPRCRYFYASGSM